MFAYRRSILISVLLGLFTLSLLAIPACSQNTAEPSALTGQSPVSDDTHPRHSSGIASQAADF